MDGDLPYIPVVVNAANNSGLAGYQVEAAVVKALLAWQAATNFGFEFDVWVGREPAIYPASQAVDGYTTIHFASRNPNAFGLTARQAGFATLAFDQETGEIVEGDIALNDVQFQFTADELETNYAAEGFLGKTAFIDDVVLHEVGHLLGLGHTGVSSSSLFPTVWSGQATIGCADAHGLRELYQPLVGTSTIRGQVDVERAREWPGVEVLAISTRRRTVVASAFTGPDGRYAITGLTSDTYLLMAQPYLGDPADLPSPLAESVQLPCDVSRGFSPPVRLDPGTSEVVDLVLPCDGGADLLATTSSLESPINLQFDADNRVIAVFRLDPGADGHWFRLPPVEGALSLDVLSHSLFSSAIMTAEMRDDQGQPIFGDWVMPVEPSHDAPRRDGRMLTFLDTGVERYLWVRASRLPTDLYPGRDIFVDDRSYAVLVGEVTDRWEDPLGCHPEASVGYVSPGVFPQRSWNPVIDTGKRGCALDTSTSERGPAGWGWALLLAAALRRRARTRRR